MKKILPYILTLIMLIGLLSPITVVYGIDSDYSDPSLYSPPAPSSGCNFATNPNPKFQDLLSYATCIISGAVIPLIFALAVVMFVWGVVQYVINSDEEAKKAKGKQFMIWGIIALAVMVSVWGLVAILSNTFGIDTTFIPQVKT